MKGCLHCAADRFAGIEDILDEIADVLLRKWRASSVAIGLTDRILARHNGCLHHPLRQFRPPSSLDRPFDGHPDRLLLPDHDD